MACKIEPVGGELLKPWPFIIDDAHHTFITPVLRFAETTSECKRWIPKPADGKAIELIGSKISSSGASFILGGEPTAAAKIRETLNTENRCCTGSAMGPKWAQTSGNIGKIRQHTT